MTEFNIETQEIVVDGVSIAFPRIYASKIYNNLKNIIEGKDITRTNVISTVLQLMSMVETYKELSGLQKKGIVIDSLHNLVNEQITDISEKNDLILLIDLTIPHVIDNFINIDRKKLRIKMQKTCSTIFSCLKS